MSDIKGEADAFDKNVDNRIKKGFIPDLRRLGDNLFFINNVWREPEFVRIHWLPKINYVIDVAKKRGGSVLELGCGMGYLCLELARNGLQVTGIDVSPRSIEVAKQYASENTHTEGFGSLEYRCEDFCQTDLGQSTYDTVVFFRSLHHIGNLNPLMRKVHKALKPGGNLVICEPIRGEFTTNAAALAGLIRLLAPTWETPMEKSIRCYTEGGIEDYVQRIYDEYTYAHEHQSPNDNDINRYADINAAVAERFDIKQVLFEDAFMDRIIGGLRGDDRFVIAKALKNLDAYFIKHSIMPPTSVTMYATKREE